MDKVKLLRQIFPNEDESFLEQCVPFVEEAISTLDERQQCVLQKKFSGETLRAIAPAIAKVCGGKPCDGISVTRVKQIGNRALRLLQQPDRIKILRGEIKASDFLDNIFKKEAEKETPSQELLSVAEKYKQSLIKDIEMSHRTRSCLEHAGIASIGDLVLKTKKEMAGIKNFGRKSLEELKDILWDRGLKFKDD